MQWISTNFPGVRYREHGTRKMRNGQFDRYYTVRYRVNGQRKEEPIGWASEGWNPEKAYKVLSSILAGVRTGEGPQSLAEKRRQLLEVRAAEKEEQRKAQIQEMSIRDFFYSVYMPRAMREKRSWRTDEQRINKEILPALGDYPLCAVTAADVQSFLDSLTDSGMAPATVRQYMSVLRRAYNMASETVIDGIPIFTGKSPVQGLRLPAVYNSRERYLTAVEAEALIQAAADLRSPDLHDAILLSLNTGLRLGELLRLRWIDVDWTSRIITIPDEAQRKPGGKVPINNHTLAILLCRREMQGGRCLQVFPPAGKGKARENLSHVFRQIVEKLHLNDGIDDPRHRIVFHSLRHTFASWLALANVDIYRIKTLLRHKTISMTMRYAHLIPDATRDAVHNLKPPSL